MPSYGNMSFVRLQGKPSTAIYIVFMIDFIFQIIVLVMSVVIHEVAHGYAAFWLGDSTAKYEGRLTLNPIKHLDPFGSVILPLLLAISGSNFMIGWAKPVPFNPYNLRNQKWGEAIVAAAGPLSNILIALVLGLTLRLGIAFGIIATIPVIKIISLIIFINLLLAIFNLVPIPPLDGSKILFSILPRGTGALRAFLERYGFFIVLLFVFFLWEYVSPLIVFIFRIITGVN